MKEGVSFSDLPNIELESAKAHWYGERALNNGHLANCEAEMKRKADARDKILDRLRILENVLNKELNEEIVSLSKYKQVKEAIYNTQNLLDGLQPPIERLENDIAEAKEHAERIEANIKLINAEMRSRGKVVSFDRFRSTQEDPA